jgi:hypothetical protein
MALLSFGKNQRGGGRPQRCHYGPVRQALGRAQGDFADYARKAAATGAWNGATLAA